MAGSQVNGAAGHFARFCVRRFQTTTLVRNEEQVRRAAAFRRSPPRAPEDAGALFHCQRMIGGLQLNERPLTGGLGVDVDLQGERRREDGTSLRPGHLTHRHWSPAHSSGQSELAVSIIFF